MTGADAISDPLGNPAESPADSVANNRVADSLRGDQAQLEWLLQILVFEKTEHQELASKRATFPANSLEIRPAGDAPGAGQLHGSAMDAAGRKRSVGPESGCNAHPDQ